MKVFLIALNTVTAVAFAVGLYVCFATLVEADRCQDRGGRYVPRVGCVDQKFFK